MNLDFFKNKKILIVVPHEDDEICVTGGLLASIDNSNTRVVYTTNGNYIYNSNVRYKEAINSCKKFGISKENIIFLGYSDCPYDEKNHMYTTKGIWKDKYFNNKTSGAYGINEYCFKRDGIHKDFTKNNLIEDIKNNIIEFIPDIIIGVDLDFHPDHIMTSLCLEKAIGEVIHEINDYYPLVLKGFAYENAYLGPFDYNDDVIKESYYNYEKNNHLNNNPYYSKLNGINISLNKEAYTRNLYKNKLYKSILCHTSQALVLRTFSIINPNVVLWPRNTRNLIKNAIIEVSSGNKDYLSDFLLCDSDYILNGNNKKIIYNKGIWIPDKKDIKKSIKIKLDSKKYVSMIKIYNGINNKKQVENIQMNIDGKISKYDNKEIILEIPVDKCIQSIEIKILDKIIENGFSEIEILCDENKKMTNDIPKYDDFHYSKFINILVNSINIFFTKVYRKLFIKKH